VADLVRYRINKETLVKRAVETDLRLSMDAFGLWPMKTSSRRRAPGDGDGQRQDHEPVLVRVHTENVTCDMFGSLIDDTGFNYTQPWKKLPRQVRAWSLPATA